VISTVDGLGNRIYSCEFKDGELNYTDSNDSVYSVAKKDKREIKPPPKWKPYLYSKCPRDNTEIFQYLDDSIRDLLALRSIRLQVLRVSNCIAHTKQIHIDVFNYADVGFFTNGPRIGPLFLLFVHARNIA
jgi:hypothetical protein